MTELNIRRGPPSDVAVCVVAGGGEPASEGAVAAVRSHTPAPFDLVVVTNAARARAHEPSAELGNACFVDAEADEGFAWAANHAVAATSARWLAIVPASTTVAAGWLTALTGRATEDAVTVATTAAGELVGVVLGRGARHALGGFDPSFLGIDAAVADLLRRAERAGVKTASAALAGVTRAPSTPAATAVAADDESVLATKVQRAGEVRIEPSFERLMSAEAAPLAFPSTKPRRLLGVPAWGNPAWRDVMTSVFRTLGARDPVALVLRLEPPTPELLAHAQREVLALLRAANVRVEDAPDVVFEATPLSPSERAGLYTASTAYLPFPGRRERVYRREAVACRVPVVDATPAALRAFAGGVATAEVDYAATAIVSTYKSAAFMRGCLDDLLAQTLHANGKLEIVVVDSGSPEDEASIVREFQARSPHVRYLRTERETIYGAWNQGVRVARGRYLTNANTDDRHHPEALERLAQVLDDRPDVALAFHDQLVTDRPHETWHANTARERFSWPAFAIDRLLHQCTIGPQPMWRRELHDRWGLFDDRYRVAGDWEFWLRIARGERLFHVPEALGLYFRNLGGLEHSSSSSVAEAIEVRRRYQALHVAGRYEDGGTPAANVAVFEASELVGRGDVGAACDRLARELASSPTPDVLVGLATVLTSDGRVGDAAEVLSRGLVLHPGNPSITLRLARLMLLAGKIGDAERLASASTPEIDARVRDEAKLVREQLAVEPREPVSLRAVG